MESFESVSASTRTEHSAQIADHLLEFRKSQIPATDSYTTHMEATKDQQKPERAVTACNTCRSRKIKCSGVRPTCQTCAKSGQSCIYPAGSKRRRENRVSEDEGRYRRRELSATSRLVRLGPTIEGESSEPRAETVIDDSSLASLATPALTMRTPNADTSGVTFDLNDLLGFDPDMMHDLASQMPAEGIHALSDETLDQSHPLQPKYRLRVPFFRLVPES